MNDKKSCGHWIIEVDNNRTWDCKRFICSSCKDWQTYGKTRYCPNCGCPMEKENEQDNNKNEEHEAAKNGE